MENGMMSDSLSEKIHMQIPVSISSYLIDLVNNKGFEVACTYMKEGWYISKKKRNFVFFKNGVSIEVTVVYKANGGVARLEVVDDDHSLVGLFVAKIKDMVYYNF